MFNIYSATNYSQFENLFCSILKEIEKVLCNGVNEKELTRTKEQIKSNLIIGLESMNSRMTHYGKSKLILKYIKSQDEMIKKINGVTVNGLKHFAEKVLDFSEMSTSIVGNMNKIDIERIEKDFILTDSLNTYYDFSVEQYSLMLNDVIGNIENRSLHKACKAFYSYFYMPFGIM